MREQCLGNLGIFLSEILTWRILDLGEVYHVCRDAQVDFSHADVQILDD